LIEAVFGRGNGEGFCFRAEGIAVVRLPDSMEELTLEMERNLAVDRLNRRAALLGQVTEALERIAVGRYGLCLACEGPISPKRLAALPWAALCLECQEAAENGLGIDGSASLRMAHGVSDEGKRLSARLPRRPAIPRASTNVGTINAQARL
jgi:RNA polymerase-binding protein DksA